LPVVRNAIDARQVRILATTEPLLFLPWAVKRSMPARLRESIQAILVELGSTPAGREILKAAGTTRLGKAGDRDYDPHRRMITAVFGGEGAAVRAKP
jgi:ABC-type phosphate/phosphonate transport system substrate-binding protein